MQDFDQSAIALALLGTMGTMVVVGIYLVIRTSRLTTKQAEKLIAEGKMAPRKPRRKRKEKMPPGHLGGASGASASSDPAGKADDVGGAQDSGGGE